MQQEMDSSVFQVAANARPLSEPIALAGGGRAGGTQIRRIGVPELVNLIERFGKETGVNAPADIVIRLLAHNPDIIRRVIRIRDGRDCGWFAFLPLTDTGAQAFVENRFDTLSPDIAHVCAESADAAAVYIWCLHGRGTFVPLADGFSRHLDSLGLNRVAIFTRALNGRLQRLYAKIGFEPAKDLYPQIGQGVLMRLPVMQEPAPKPAITTRLIRNANDMHKIVALRAMSYIDEQNCSWNEEFEGNDFCAAHLIAEIGDEPVGCIRMRFFGDFAKMERLAVHPRFRRAGAGYILTAAAFDMIAKKGYRRVYGQATAKLVPFYERFGFRVMADRAPFHFSDGEYYEIVAEIEPAPDAIHLESGPHVIIRPEGEWNVPGVYDRSASRGAAGSSAWGRTRT